MVNLQALEAAVTKIERIRDHEFSFEVDGTKICLRPLRPDEETEVQKFSQEAMENVREGQADQAAFAEFMDRMRHASLAFSIVQIGSLDLRDVEFVETGEVDEHGNNVSVPKWEAVRDLIAREWSRIMLSQVFGKFGEMLDRIELRAQKAVSFEPVDLEEEIERTARRLEELKEAKERVKRPDPDKLTAAQKGIADLDHQAQENRNRIRDKASEARNAPSPQEGQAEADAQRDSQPSVEPERSQPPQPPQQSSEQAPQSSEPPQGRRSSIPTSAAAPPERKAPEQPQQPQQENYVDERGIMLPPEGDSFFDPSDPGEAMAIEARRQALLHQQHVARQKAQEEEARRRREMGMPSPEEQAQQLANRQRENNRPNAVNLQKPAPGAAVSSLRQAANLQNHVADSAAGSVRTGRPNRPQPASPGNNQPAQLHGKPVYKMPAQTLDRPETTRQHGEPPAGPLQMNPDLGGSRNPNFRPKNS